MDSVKMFEEKISIAIEKIKTLKNEKAALEERIRELEGIIRQKDEEIKSLTEDKFKIKSQIEDLIKELEGVEGN
ncbi:MAG: cell division protein ZapB [Thermodesulfovibrionales bacterium]|nr:cell division protein ZapB [Thermodesulfovibrionales bacterium]